MDRLKKIGIFVALLAVLGGGAVLLFWDLGAECLSILRTGVGSGHYALAASDAEGRVYALGRTEDGYQLVIGDQYGRRTERWALREETIPLDSTPALLYPASGGAVYLGIYNTQEETTLQVYRLTEQGREAELLLSEPCPGENLQDQMAETRLSDFSEVDGVVTFALLQGYSAHFYQRTGTTGGLEELDTVTRGDLRAAMALSDGTLVLVAGNELIRTDRAESTPLSDGEIVLQLAQASNGIYYVDAANLRVYFADFADWQPYAFLSLEKESYDMDDCTDLWVTRDGDALLLVNGQQLLLDRGSTVSDLTGMLYRSPAQCVLILAGLALAVLILTTLLWFLVYDQRRLRLPLLVRWGVLVAAVAALGTGVLVRGVVRPVSAEHAQREAYSALGSSTAQLLQTIQINDPDVPQRLGDSLAQGGGGLFYDTAVSVYQQDENGVWRLVRDNTALEKGVRAELSAGFDLEHAVTAQDTGTHFWTSGQGSGTHYYLYESQNGVLLAVDAAGGPLVAAGAASCQWMTNGLIALAVLLTALTLAILCWISIGLRSALNGMERLAAGERGVHVALGGGDELASLADDVNALSDALQDVDRQQNELAQSYRRFVPERVLSLLGKTSILEVDKQTFVSRDLAAMMLRFQFPDQVYEKSGRELFDNINEILERTASIVTQKGGAVFNFAYNGYDAVFEGGSAAAVSTAVAVQQEILDLNREREVEGRAPVAVHIALDEGNVMLGVVGDENQIEPTSISSSFSVVKHLVDLCGRLEANILCTEAVMNGARGYGSRYMGKCREGGAYIRTYEIFDGDPYDIRKVKEATGERFSQGVYALYSRDFSQAKGIFLSLVHHNTGDGGARYYLYLADQLEKRPEAEISLD